MKRTAAQTAAARRANHPRHRFIPTIMIRRRVLHNRIKARRNKIRELHFDDGTQTHKRHPRRRADHTQFCHRRINHALFTKFLKQTFRHLKRAAKHANIFAHHQHARIAPHLVLQRIADCFEVRQFARVVIHPPLVTLSGAKNLVCTLALNNRIPSHSQIWNNLR